MSCISCCWPQCVPNYCSSPVQCSNVSPYGGVSRITFERFITQAHTQVQYANLLQQQQMMFNQWYGMMLQGAMLSLHPSTMLTMEQYQAYQTALQGTQVQQLRQMEQTAQQPTTPEVGVVQQAMVHQTPPHLTSLQDSSVRQTPCQSVRSQLSAVDPPLQGAVQWLGICVEALNY